MSLKWKHSHWSLTWKWTHPSVEHLIPKTAVKLLWVGLCNNGETSNQQNSPYMQRELNYKLQRSCKLDTAKWMFTKKELLAVLCDQCLWHLLFIFSKAFLWMYLLTRGTPESRGRRIQDWSNCWKHLEEAEGASTHNRWKHQNQLLVGTYLYIYVYLTHINNHPV